MFTGKRSAETNDEICRFLNKAPVLVNALSGLQIEIDSRMKTALTEMSVQRTMIVVTIEQRPELTQIVADLILRHSGVFPSFPGVGLAGNSGSRAKPQFTHPPNEMFLLRIIKEFHRGSVTRRTKAG